MGKPCDGKKTGIHVYIHQSCVDRLQTSAATRPISVHSAPPISDTGLRSRSPNSGPGRSRATSEPQWSDSTVNSCSPGTAGRTADLAHHSPLATEQQHNSTKLKRQRHNTYTAQQVATAAALYLTDNAGVQPVGHKLSQQPQDCDQTSTRSPGLPFSSPYTRNPCISTHLLTLKGWKDELAWLVDP